MCIYEYVKTYTQTFVYMNMCVYMNMYKPAHQHKNICMFVRRILRFHIYTSFCVWLHVHDFGIRFIRAQTYEYSYVCACMNCVQKSCTLTPHTYSRKLMHTQRYTQTPRLEWKGLTTFARRNKACVFFLSYILKLGLSPEIPTQID